jgi:hypothetical protein
MYTARKNNNNKGGGGGDLYFCNDLGNDFMILNCIHLHVRVRARAVYVVVE